MHKHHENIYIYIYIQITRHAIAIANQPITTPHFLGKIKNNFPWKQENQINKQRLYQRERERERDVNLCCVGCEI